MSVVLEFSIDADAFQLGRVLSPLPETHVTLERVVPTNPAVMPYLWATGGDLGAFEESVRARSAVECFQAVDRLDGTGLYRIEWVDSPSDLITAIAETDATVLEAEGDGTWVFRLRFPDHDALSAFHTRAVENGIPLHVEQTYTMTEAPERGRRVGLTPEQREALVLALRRGYFASPREVSLDVLAEDLGISRQAVSQRIRRGNEQVLRSALLPDSRHDGSGTDKRVDE